MFDPSEIQAVVFDAVGTIIHPCPGISVVYGDAVKKYCGFDADPAMIAHAFSSAMTARATGDKLTTSEDHERSFWRQVVQEICQSGPDEVSESQISQCFEQLYVHFEDPTNWKLFPDVEETLISFEQRKIPVSLASNFDRRLHAIIDGIKPLRQLSVRVISSEIGYRKPSFEFYQAVCDSVKPPAGSILMVGDDLTNDIIGATSFGMPSAWINRRRQDAEGLPKTALELHHLTDLIAVFQEQRPSATPV